MRGVPRGLFGALLERDCPEAIPKGICEAGVLVKEEVTCFMHLNQAREQKLNTMVKCGEMPFPVSQVVYEKAFDAFDEQFRPVKSMATLLDWREKHHGDHRLHVGATPPGLPTRNKVWESADQMFAHLRNDAQCVCQAHPPLTTGSR